MYVLGFRSVSTGEISKRSSKDTQKVTGMVKGEVPGKYSDRPSCPKVWTSMGMHLANSRFSGLQLLLLVIDPFKDSKMPETVLIIRHFLRNFRGPTTTSPAYRSKMQTSRVCTS
ncbi:hypothetical protein BELL_0181g00110 [Botrytis elliptica]|uniref:Uncharacterized protein n=1 Tax=Botrytis elliptica TaxID=278938 RepID=A0A4Z1K3M6_9HELO|nr:hypothetical protein BELL_0181g00110 [Botrytis elliptica]